MTKVKDVKACENCPMRRLFPENNFVPPILGPSLRLTIAEAPGETESIEGKPLVGGSGKIFDNLCRKAAIPRDQLTIINTINCRPPNNIYPTDGAARKYCSESEGDQIVEHCYRAHVKPLLDSRPWERIDALGDKALRVLTGKTDGIMKWRGSPLPLTGTDKPVVVPTLHPAYLMRDQAMIPLAISDLKKGTTVPPEWYNTKPTMQDVIDFRYTTFALDIETNRFTQQIICVGLSGQPFHAICVPFQGKYIDEIRRIMLNAKEVITHNGCAFDIPILCEALGMVWDNT